MGLRGYIIKRAIYSVILVFFVLTLNFLIFELMPGSPIEFFLGKAATGAFKDPERIRQIEEEWGLNQPLHIQYLKYIKNMLTFNFGKSARPPEKPIAQLIMEYLPNTLILMGTSTVLSIIIGVISGVIAAHKRGGKIDSTLVTSALIFYALPTFWLGLMFMVLFARTLHWFPIGGIVDLEVKQSNPPIPVNLLFTTIYIPSWAEIQNRLWHLFLPCLTLTLFQYGGFLLLTRASMLECLTEDYIVTARAKGLKERTVLFKHALKNASLPIITSAAISFGFMISGAIITETVFSWQGMGTLIWERGIQGYDYPLLHVVFYIIALCVIAANFIADLLYGIIDPRIKYG